MPEALPALSALWILPFVLLLGSIATLPLLASHWWEKKYPFVAIGLGLAVLLSYIAFLGRGEMVIHTAREYFSFIALIGSLFVISGGIHIDVRGESTPLFNCLFLAVGAVIANVIGTTGASMVLIRPWIRMNRHWIRPFHVIIFIFLISNIGGVMTPVGDPPLFLGFLRGVPFFWTVKHVWREWSFAILWVLAVFYVLDLRSRPKADPAKERPRVECKISGKRSALCLAAVVGAAFVSDPPFLREAIMLGAAVVAWRITPKAYHKENNFVMTPFREVLILFFGIFMTMMPALEWLETHAAGLGITGPGCFYWGSGTLSSFLDNAPTYLHFLSVASGLYASAVPEAGRVGLLLSQHPAVIKAISLGCVFFGAMTYIGNGPNFLVKSIAEHEKIKMASFFGYIVRYSAPILLPLFFLIGLFAFKS